nr:MAG TPA: hypothetical protein [Caudoviricetes sp.]
MYDFMLSTLGISFLVVNYILAGIWFISELLLYKRAKRENSNSSNSRYATVFIVILYLSIIFSMIITKEVKYVNEKTVIYLILSAIGLSTCIYFNSQEL